MKEETKAAFEKAVADREARVRGAAQEKEKKVSERQQFEIECRRVRDNVIIPALNQIAREVLEPLGWTCNIQPVESHIAVTLEIHKEAMRAMTGSARPYIKFVVDPHAPQLASYMATRGRSGLESSYMLSEVTEDFVHRQVLEFFQRLLSES